MPSSCVQDAGRVIRPLLRRILVSARRASCAVSRPMSLYRAGLRFALFLPLGVAIPPAVFPPCGCRVRRCEPRCHSALAGRGDHLLQLIHLFRDGPDYAFILRTGCGACYPSSVATNPSTGSRRLRAVSRPMSLYRAGLRLALFLPLGVAMPPFKRHQVSPM
jgi:hypothetical protein